MLSALDRKVEGAFCSFIHRYFSSYMKDALDMLALPYKEHKDKDLLRNECRTSIEAWIGIFSTSSEGHKLKVELMYPRGSLDEDWNAFERGYIFSKEMIEHMVDNLTNDVCNRAK